ncbi:MAG: hypothetical protein P8L66_10710 [Rhodospirillaceae bacterium]|nr:hypothetical protein [Rhodospirillaceae bacterium]
MKRIPIFLAIGFAVSGFSGSTAQTSLLSIHTDDCRQLVSHVPGVDVHGRPVIPADLGGG